MLFDACTERVPAGTALRECFWSLECTERVPAGTALRECLGSQKLKELPTMTCPKKLLARGFASVGVGLRF